MSMNDATSCDFVNNLYVQACGELFSAYGLTDQLQGQSADTRDRNQTSYVSAISATGKGIKLSSILNLDADLLANIHPSRADNLSQRDLEDWCLEFNNQLVGRMKNKLLGFGCEVMMGLPSLITGTDVSTFSPPSFAPRQYFFASTHGCLAFTLATLLAPDFELTEAESAPDSQPVMLEGAVSLF
jgi:hypothetical protein